MLQCLNVRNVEAVLVAIVVVAPSAMLPETFDDVRLVLIILRIAILARSLARQFTIDNITTSFEDETTTFEILHCIILSLILALRVCANLYYCY